MTKSMWGNRMLISRMVNREVVGRYNGSILGLGWSLLNPLFMLILYTFLFSVVFDIRWGVEGDQGNIAFAVVLYVGLICHSILTEVATRAPVLIQQNVNYVKKVVFPLEILPPVIMGSAIFHAIASILVLLLLFLVTHGFIYWTAVLAPLVLLPLLPVTLGFAWFLASVGTYLRDVGQTVGLISTALLFFSPVFYPLSALPEQFRGLLFLNPLTFIIEEARQVLIFGQLPNWMGLAIYTLVSLLFCWVGFWWFQKTRKGFADVL
jgi:lipopolysaccharide transport system permease protein